VKYSSIYQIFLDEFSLLVSVSFSNKLILSASNSNQQGNTIDTSHLSSELSLSACMPMIALVCLFDYTTEYALSILVVLIHDYFYRPID